MNRSILPISANFFIIGALYILGALIYIFVPYYFIPLPLLVFGIIGIIIGSEIKKEDKVVWYTGVMYLCVSIVFSVFILTQVQYLIFKYGTQFFDILYTNLSEYRSYKLILNYYFGILFVNLAICSINFVFLLSKKNIFRQIQK